MNQKSSLLQFIFSLLIVGTIGIFRRNIPLSSPMLAFSRGLLGAASLLIFVRLQKENHFRKLSGLKLAGLVLNGVFLGINWILLFEAYAYTTIAKATLCYYLQPTIVLLFSPLVFGEKLTLKKMICALTALAGMILVSGVINAEGGRPDDLKGILFGLGAACFYSLVVILNKKIGDDVDAFQKTIIQLASTAAVLIPYLAMTEGFNDVELNIRTVSLLLIVGIIHTGLTYALYFGSMSGLKAQTISMLSYIDPVVALFISAVVLREPMTVSAGIGAVMIIVSAFVSES